MSEAARAYQYGSTAPAPRRERDVRVIPGRRRQIETLDARLIAFAKIALVALVAFAVLGCVRIGLTSLAVSSSIATSQIESNIDTARAEGTTLEVEQSKLTNPAVVKQAAEKMGMSAPVSTEMLKLPADVVATDDAGNLSLSKSLAIAAGK